ncbi:TatD family hydrolase [Methylophaga sp. OBS3]|uniref:TatD family hydrolase n=1 Tax=Methylophaga sp. OBS3 TaxID=2991934 RepID=UPI0022520822|nr:TatD family hydrolase [Methylophaga sp. OBS3]MCX4190158.1 TatD family hydrolase [Methylophaga sp. OBS3]
MLPLIDSHCHLDFPAFDDDRETIIENCLNQGMTHIVIPAVTESRWQSLVETCQQSSMLFYALGYHPMFMDQHPEDPLNKLEAAIQQYSPIALGEIGLDFFLHGHDKKAQLALFEGQLGLAKKYDLPIILHVRKAHDDVLKLLRRYQLKGGIVHAFSGSLQQAQQYQELGFLLGIGGALTYPRAQRLQGIFSQLPLEQIVLETDAPDMPLCGHQGERNSPEYIPIVAETLADIRDESLQDIAAQSTANLRKLLNI